MRQSFGGKGKCIVLCGLATAALSACTLVLDHSAAQCESTVDCEELGFSGTSCQDKMCKDVSWSCLGRAQYPEGTGRVSHRIRFVSAVTNEPISSISCSLCGIVDAACSRPILTGLVPDADGALHVEMAGNSEGYLRVDSGGIYKQALVYLHRPLVVPPTEKAVRLTTDAEHRQLVSVTQQEVEPIRHGTAIVITTNCFDERAQGVVVASEDDDQWTVPFYFRGQLPYPQGTQTDAQGAAGFLNLPVGVADVKARRAASDAPIGAVAFLIEADAVTYIHLGPKPVR